MVIVEDIAKTFKLPKGKSVEALKGVSFEAKAGEVFGLLGINGAGKTTGLRILSTVIKPDRGHASICGCDVVTQSAEVRKSIGFLSSTTGLYQRLTGRQVLHYFGGLYGLDGAKLSDRIDYVIAKLRLEEFVDRVCDKLSTGQKQRVSIARTILHDPPVLFFDEPTTGLDVVTAQTIMEFIEECRAAGKAVVLSSHIMSEVERLCDHVSVIHEGRIFASGTSQEIKNQTGADTLEKAFLNLVGYKSEIA